MAEFSTSTVGKTNKLLTVAEGTPPHRDPNIHKKKYGKENKYSSNRSKLTDTHFQMMLRHCAKFQLMWLKSTYFTNETADIHTWCSIHEDIQDGRSTGGKSPVFDLSRSKLF